MQCNAMNIFPYYCASLKSKMMKRICHLYQTILLYLFILFYFIPIKSTRSNLIPIVISYQSFDHMIIVLCVEKVHSCIAIYPVACDSIKAARLPCCTLVSCVYVQKQSGGKAAQAPLTHSIGCHLLYVCTSDVRKFKLQFVYTTNALCSCSSA